MGVIGCILGFLIVIYLCYKDWSVYLATFAGACVVIACNTLPFIDSLVGDYVSGMFTAVKSFFFMILFGCLQSKIYTESGAAYTIADTVMNRLLKENMSNTGKNLIGMSVILVIGTILNLGGIIAGVVIVLMYPIALVIFERCDIPKKFILGILGAGSFTFTLTVPGSPQVTNVAAMTVLGTAADVALVPGLVGAAAEIAAILVIMNLLINRARKRGEHFELHPLDPRYDSTGSKPKLIVALPIIAPKLQALGLTASTIHRVSAFAATTLDSMPYSGSILMLLPMCHMKLKEVYPALFVTTVIATTVGTAAVTLMCVLFPGLA